MGALRGLYRRVTPRLRTQQVVIDLNADATPAWEPLYIKPSAAPTKTGVAGSIYFDSTANALYQHNGSSYAEVGTVPVGNVTVASTKTLAVTTADKLTVGGIIVPQYIEVDFEAWLNADCVDRQFFLAHAACQVVAAYEIHAVAGNDAGAVNLQLVKDTGTNAPGAGTDLLTNNTNAGFDLKGTAQTMQTGTLTGTTASLQLAAGNRLSADFAGTVTTLSGLLMHVVLKRI